jgi:hypothetical protein
LTAPSSEKRAPPTRRIMAFAWSAKATQMA